MLLLAQAGEVKNPYQMVSQLLAGHPRRFAGRPRRLAEKQ